MGCVSSAYLQEEEEEGGRRNGSIISHHIVSLTSTTYGLLTTLDQQPTTTTSTPTTTIHSPDPSSSPEVINSWELMAGLDPIVTPIKPKLSKRCPRGGEESVVLYTTTLRGIRKTFEDCNAVRSAIEGIGVCVKERDVSMDLGFREELRELTKGPNGVVGPTVLPVLFVKGRYVGGAEQVLRIHEEGRLAELLEGMPRRKDGGSSVCDGCGGIMFLPCFRCSGSRKVENSGKVVRCPDCNENGLVLCPICS